MGNPTQCTQLLFLWSELYGTDNKLFVEENEEACLELAEKIEPKPHISSSISKHLLASGHLVKAGKAFQAIWHVFMKGSKGLLSSKCIHGRSRGNCNAKANTLRA